MKNSIALILALIATALLVDPAAALPLSTSQERLTLRPATVVLTEAAPAAKPALEAEPAKAQAPAPRDAR
jgi:hypothetical protein